MQYETKVALALLAFIAFFFSLVLPAGDMKYPHGWWIAFVALPLMLLCAAIVLLVML